MDEPLVTLSEARSWDPAISQVTMCEINRNTIVIRGRQDVSPYDHIVKLYSLRGTLLSSWPSKCCHNWDVGLQCLEIDSTPYIVESCPECQQIRLYTKEGGSRRTAYENTLHFPGKMCLGPTMTQIPTHAVFEYDDYCVVEYDRAGSSNPAQATTDSSLRTLLVYDTKGNFILELDCSSKKFKLIRSHETGLTKVNGMCYVDSKEMLVLTSQEIHMIKAIHFSTGNTIWCLHYKIEGKICQPFDVRFDPLTGYLFVADGDNKRILLLTVTGLVKHSHYEDKMGAIYRLIFLDSEPRLVVRDSYPNHKIKCYNLRLVQQFERYYTGLVHPSVY